MRDHPESGASGERGGTATKTVESTPSAEQHALAQDWAHARELRDRLDAIGARMVNLIGSPGAGKTELLCALIPRLRGKRPCIAAVGDLATDYDARRIRASGAPAHQIRTGTTGHLTAQQIGQALDHLPLRERSLVLVENVGDLVCPSMYYLGESLRLVCLSVAEGSDKPRKYPVAYRDADLVLITKHDLLPHVDFDLELALQGLESLTPGLPVLVTSARTGEGLDELVERLRVM